MDAHILLGAESGLPCVLLNMLSFTLYENKLCSAMPYPTAQIFKAAHTIDTIAFVIRPYVN